MIHMMVYRLNLLRFRHHVHLFRVLFFAGAHGIYPQNWREAMSGDPEIFKFVTLALGSVGAVFVILSPAFPRKRERPCEMAGRLFLLTQQREPSQAAQRRFSASAPGVWDRLVECRELGEAKRNQRLSKRSSTAALQPHPTLPARIRNPDVLLLLMPVEVAKEFQNE